MFPLVHDGSNPTPKRLKNMKPLNEVSRSQLWKRTIAARNIPTDELEAVALAKTELTKPVKVSPAEALKIQRDLDLTDNKMAALRVFLIKHNVDIFPTMKVLRDEKKSTYPENRTELVNKA